MADSDATADSRTSGRARRLAGPAPGQAYPPLDPRRTAARLVGGGLLLALALLVAGLALVRLPALEPLVALEDSLSSSLADRDSGTWQTLTHAGSVLAETWTCVLLLLVAALLLRWWLGRWRESWALGAALAGELLIFLAVSALVDRPRPDVRQLDAAPPTSSFPSGHTGAAVAAYGCLAVILLRQLPRRRLARVLATVLLLVPVVVGVARLYRGMHHLSDVVFGAVNGGVWLWIVVTTLLPAVAATQAAPATRGTDSRPVGPDPLPAGAPPGRRENA